jgi:large subunit ribosomal protein L3
MTGILGRKLGMTQVFDENGRLWPVTVIEAGPCGVVQIKTRENDGYESVKIGFEEVKKEKRVDRPTRGIFKKAGLNPCRVMKEFPMADLKVGEMVTVEKFRKGDMITVTGISIGKGFQGVMKRHNYAGGPASHGSTSYREVGSIGASSYPSRVWKNKGMPGHMGSERVSVKNLKVIDVRVEQNLLLISGAVPGAKGTYLEIRKES